MTSTNKSSSVLRLVADEWKLWIVVIFALVVASQIEEINKAVWFLVLGLVVMLAALRKTGPVSALLKRAGW